MKVLTEYYKKFLLVLIIPYLFISFILFVRIPFAVYSPGGISEVEDLIEINYNQDKVITGSISTTYIMAVQRPTYFQFILGTLSPYASISNLSTTYETYTNQEIAQISYLDKETSVDASIIIAYTYAKKINPDIEINYVVKSLVYGKAEYLDHYDEINFGDEFIKLIGDGGYVVTDISEISDYTKDSTSYDFTFKNEDGEIYTLTLSTDSEYDKFGVTLKEYAIVDNSTIYPTYTERQSNIGGPSGGLLQTLAIYNHLIDEDLTHGLKIAGTGTIRYDGSVGYIGGVEQKIITAYVNKVDLFFIPSLDPTYTYDNYQVALKVCEKYGIDSDGWLIPVSSFADAVAYLEGLDES